MTLTALNQAVAILENANQRSSRVRNAITHLRRQIQLRPVGWDNFHNGTIAVFEPCSIPTRTPDFISLGGSMYWAEPDGVIRASDHWGPGIKSCDWYLKTETFVMDEFYQHVGGFCRYADFTKVVWLEGRRHVLNCQQLEVAR